MYREPETPGQLLMYYFVSRELYIAHSLARHFHWHQVYDTFVVTMFDQKDLLLEFILPVT